MIFESTGVLRYGVSETAGYRLVVEIDQDLADYYRSLIPRWHPTSRQRYGAHISVVRREVPPVLDAWGRYEGESVDFLYENTIRSGEVYWWLNCFCVRLEEIRLELGLPVSSPYTRPPDGFSKCFHCTIGNEKQA